MREKSAGRVTIGLQTVKLIVKPSTCVYIHLYCYGLLADGPPAFAFLPYQPPVPSPVVYQSLWVSLEGTVHAGMLCGVLGLGWSAEERRGNDCAAQGPCCLPFLLGAFRSFRVCSAGYCRFIKPQWLKHNTGRTGVMAKLEPQLQPNNHWHTKKL